MISQSQLATLQILNSTKLIAGELHYSSNDGTEIPLKFSEYHTPHEEDLILVFAPRLTVTSPHINQGQPFYTGQAGTAFALEGKLGEYVLNRIDFKPILDTSTIQSDQFLTAVWTEMIRNLQNTNVQHLFEISFFQIDPTGSIPTHFHIKPWNKVLHPIDSDILSIWEYIPGTEYYVCLDRDGQLVVGSGSKHSTPELSNLFLEEHGLDTAILTQFLQSLMRPGGLVFIQPSNTYFPDLSELRLQAIYDMQEEAYCSTYRTLKIAEQLGIKTVPILLTEIQTERLTDSLLTTILNAPSSIQESVPRQGVIIVSSEAGDNKIPHATIRYAN